jgi:hypothetical protein
MCKILCLALSVLMISCSARGGESRFTVKMGGAQIDVTVADGRMQLTQAEITRWVQNAAESVTA